MWAFHCCVRLYLKILPCAVFYSNSPLQQTRASYKLDSARVDIINSSSKKKQASILPALVKAFGPTFIFGALLKLIQDLLTFVSPQILK